MPINETIVTGKKFRVFDKIANKWNRISYWTKASDVELNDGSSVETKVANIDADISELNSNLSYCYDMGVKNLLSNKQPKVLDSGQGLTFTANDDGTITINGTSTSSMVIYAMLSSNTKPFSTRYKVVMQILSGTVSNGTIYGQVYCHATQGGNANYLVSDTFTTAQKVIVGGALPDNQYAYIARMYVSGNGAVLTNLKVKFMIVPEFCTNYDSVPYAQSNAALTKRAVLTHNIPRFVPKDITSYVTDGTLWQRLNGTNGFDLFEDIYCGDYIHMSRAISAYEQTQTYQATGSDYVTIAEIDGKMGDGDSSPVNYHHLVMVPGKGFGGTQHFGRSRMNATNTTVGGYKGSEMFTTTIGAVVSSGSTASQATINQQLYSEFGSHLKTIRQLLSNSINATGYNRFGTNLGCTNNWEWTSVQAFLMSEIEVYGSVVWGSSGYDVGNGNHQFTLFRHSKEAMNNRTAYYWLKDVAAAASFARVSTGGSAAYDFASYASYSVRPCFVIA